MEKQRREGKKKIPRETGRAYFKYRPRLAVLLLPPSSPPPRTHASESAKPRPTPASIPGAETRLPAMGMGPLDNAASAALEAAAAPSRAGSYAVLQCGEDSEYVRQKYGGYFAVFRALLEEDGESWRVYRAVGGELPTDAEAAGFDGFVISGSCSDAHGDEPWILDLVGLIRRLHAAGKRILGVCFGHQVPIP
jgi:hypothetical protein